MSAEGQGHTVQDGEWLLGIAQKYSVGFEELKSLNPGIDYDVIVPGQQIILPEYVEHRLAVSVSLPILTCRLILVDGLEGTRALGIGF